MTSWVRPALAPSDLPSDDIERKKLAETERDHYRQLYTAQMLRATELADQLRELQSLPESALLNPNPPLIFPVDVTGRRASEFSGIVELKLSQGASGRVLEGDIAIVGRDIVGRVTRIGLTRLELTPISHKDMTLTRAAVVPAHPSSGRAPLLAEIIMQSTGSTTMVAEVTARSGIQKGDLVQLDDPSWPAVGAGLTLGVVADIQQIDEAPLRQRILIVPRRSTRDLPRVVVLGTGEITQ